MTARLRAQHRWFGRQQLEEHTVVATPVDHAVLHDVRNRAPVVDEMIRTPPSLPSGEQADPLAWERMAEDLWTEAFGISEPQVRAKPRVNPRFEVNRQIADKQARSEKLPEMRQMTRGQRLESALWTRGALSSLQDSYGRELAEHAETQREIGEQSDRIDDIDDLLEQLRQQRAQPDADQPGIDQTIRKLATEKRRAVDKLKQAEHAQVQSAGSLVDAAGKAIGKAIKQGDEMAACGSLMPGSAGGEGHGVSAETAFALAERIHGSRVLRRVLELLGALEPSMSSKRFEKRRGGFEEMTDIELGNDLSAILPHEKMLLRHPIGKWDFYRRFHERSLMQYEFWSEEELKRGPFIACADSSGSMSGARNEFARALTLSTCMIANHEQRTTAAIEFGSTGQLREFTFPGDRPLDTETMLDYAEHFYGKGTDINGALVRAKELIDSEKPFHSADILLITDGGDIVTPETIEIRDALRAMNVKIHGICIGMDPTPYITEVCSHWSSVFDYTGPCEGSDSLAINLT